MKSDGRIVFTTFYQSYGYEEFIEGIKPVMNDAQGGDIKYVIEDGVFKHFCNRELSITLEETTIFDKAVGNVGKLP